MQFMSKMEAINGKMDQAIQDQQTTSQNLERQIGQLAKVVSNRENGKLPSIFQVNPTENVMAISLRSRKVLEEPSVREEPQIKKVVNMEIKGEKVQDKKLSSNKNDEVKPYVSLIPFPQRLKAQTQTKEFMKLLEMFNKLELNILFLEVISQMPNYANF